MFEPRDPDFEARVRSSFAAQSAMKSLQIQLISMPVSYTHLTLPTTPYV